MVAGRDRPQLAPAADDPAGRSGRADLEGAVGREALAAAGDDEHSRRRHTHKSLRVVEPLDHPHPAEPAAGDLPVAVRRLLRLDEPVEPAHHAGMPRGIEAFNGGLFGFVERREAHTAAGHERRLRLGRIGPEGKPADEIVE